MNFRCRKFARRELRDVRFFIIMIECFKETYRLLMDSTRLRVNVVHSVTLRRRRVGKRDSPPTTTTTPRPFAREAAVTERYHFPSAV